MHSVSTVPASGNAAGASPQGVRLLIAEDDPISRRMLEATLLRWGHQIVVTSDGPEAWQALGQEHDIALAILDWMMPGMDGVEICRRVRAEGWREPPYLILLTARGSKEDIVEGLQGGADDYITKPFDRNELRARVEVGLRVVRLQRSLAERVGELEQALETVQQLRGLLPICCYCKKIRNTQNYWQQVEAYVSAHADVQFSHGICPDCYQRVLADDAKRG